MMVGAVGAAGEPGAGPFVGEGFVRIQSQDEEFELRGTVGTHIKVGWHKSFDDGLDLGTAPELAGAVAEALGVGKADEFTKSLNDKLEALKNVPVVNNFAEIIEKAPIKITDLSIDTLARSYKFGFGWDLASMGAEYKGIKLEAFGFVFTYTAPASTG